MTTPFDEVSVDKAVEFGVDLLKVASSDIRDKRLLRKIASAGKPVIASTGGSSLADVDNLVELFAEAGVPFAINHCVSIYPSEDGELDLNQIDFLRARYPEITIGFSSHEMTDWSSSILIAYGKGYPHLRAACRHRRRRGPGLALLHDAGPGRHLVQGLQQGQRDVRRIG